jgi:hypothetical protein
VDCWLSGIVIATVPQDQESLFLAFSDLCFGKDFELMGSDKIHTALHSYRCIICPSVSPLSLPLRTSGKVRFFRKIAKFGKKRINSKTFFFFARFKKVRSSSNKSSNFFWRKVWTKFEQSSNKLRRNSSNSCIQVSLRCFVFRRCQFNIYIKIRIT